MRHGKRSSYASGCRCDACRAANRDYMREWSRADTIKKRGEKLTVDADCARNEISRLQNCGLTYREIAAAAGVSIVTLGRIATGWNSRIRSETERRIVKAAKSGLGPAK